MAAMGATPKWALLAGALPDNDAAWLAAFARGFYALADAHGVELVGGDTTRGPLNLCVTIMGEVPDGTGADARGREARRRRLRVGHARRRGARRRRDDRPHGARRRRARGGASARLETPTPRIALGHRAARRRDGGARRLRRPRRRSGAHSRALGASAPRSTSPAVPRSPALERMLDGAERALALDVSARRRRRLRALLHRAARGGGRRSRRSREALRAAAGADRHDHRRRPGSSCATSAARRSPALPRAYDHFA